jgi:hypothetical protein
VRDDAVHTRVTAHLQAAGVDADEGLDDGLERVDAEIGRARRMRGLAVEDELHPTARQRSASHHVAARRMQHERGVDVVEHAGLGEQDLAAAALLGRRADDQHAPGKALAAPGEGEAGAERARGDDVVAARMPDTRQRVVLGQDGQRRARLAKMFRSISVRP